MSNPSSIAHKNKATDWSVSKLEINILTNHVAKLKYGQVHSDY